ncbi:NAD(P)/FAD-dependent oxidoreductase [Dryocola sp. BD613]|uniref:NAD(P)/FAD-dependent oxidoreductase n=1 Tax=Dryocola sp. BD613 TaxID=3133272 RepID=UPI003F501C70
MTAGIVIIGGGQAAGWAAKTLRDQGWQGELSVVADEPWDFYERPPLSKAALLETSPAMPHLFSGDVLSALNITWYRPQRAEAILRDEKVVVLNSGERLPYQQLLIATGGRARLPGAAWQEHPQVYTLRHWEDARRLKQRLAECRSLAVVGGGWIGLEIAASARRLGIAVTVFEQQAALCQRSVSAPVSAALLQMHQQQGVTLHCACGPISLADDGGLPVIACGGQAQRFDAVVVGIGVDLNLELARQADLAIEQGIVVDAQGRTSDPAIFAAGDVAQHPDYRLCLQSWAFAQNQAISTARAMLDASAAGYSDAPWLWSDQYQHNIQILGIPQPDGETVVRRSQNSELFFTLKTDGTLSQLVAFNDARTIKLAKRWMAAGRVLQDIPLADPDFSLMSLR